MATLVTSLPLTTVTADALQQELVDNLKVDFPDWTDTQTSNNMIMLLETISAVFELDYAYVNRMARESFIQYALDYRNVTAHARSLGYQPSYQSPSVVTATLVSASAVTANTVIPANTPFACVLTGVVYQTIADVVIPAGHTTSAPVVLWQQQSFTDNATGTGQPNQTLSLNNNPTLPSSVSVIINGVAWAAVNTFVDYSASAQVYTWTMDLNGRYTIQFGNGVSGKIVPLNAAITVNYNVGGGSKNSIGANQLGVCLGNVSDAGNSTLLSLSASNPLAAVQGGDSETVAQIKAHALANVRAPRCLLTLDDIRSAVNSVQGVQTCIAADWNTIPFLPRHLVEIFVYPVGGGQPSSNLINAITQMVTVTKPMVLGQSPLVAGPTYRTFNYNLQVFAQSGYNQIAVQNAVLQLLTTLFDPTTPAGTYPFSVDFGVAVFVSPILALLQQVPGVRNMAILSPGDTQLATNEFPVLGTVTFTSTT